MIRKMKTLTFTRVNDEKSLDKERVPASLATPNDLAEKNVRKLPQV